MVEELLFQVTLPLVPDGEGVALSCSVLPMASAETLGEMRSDEGAGRSTTRTDTRALTSRLTAEEIVIVALPARLVVIRPAGETTSTRVLLLE